MDCTGRALGAAGALTPPSPTGRGPEETELLFIAQQNGFQRDFDHVVEGGLTLSSRGLLVGTDVVRHGADGQRFRTELSRDAVDASCFHFHAQMPYFSITSNISPPSGA